MVPWSSLAFAWQTKFSIDASVSGMLLTVSDGSAGGRGAAYCKIPDALENTTYPEGNEVPSSGSQELVAMECGQEDENDANDGCETNVWLILPWVLAVRHLCGCVCVEECLVFVGLLCVLRVWNSKV